MNRKILFILPIAFIFLSGMCISNKEVVLVVASKNYQQAEYSVTKNLLEKTGFTVKTASDKTGTAVSAGNFSTTYIDLLVGDIIIDNYAGIFFIGGPGALEHLDNETSYQIMKKTTEVGKPLGAICISTRILAKAGVLQGKRATGWDGDNKLSAIYQQYGVSYIRQNVVVDGNIVTGRDPSAAQEFGQKIVDILQKH